MFIILTDVQNPRKPRAMRVRADQVQIAYRYDYMAMGEGVKTVTQVEILGRAGNLTVEQTPDEIIAMVKQASPSNMLLHEMRALRQDLQPTQATHTAEPIERQLARLVCATWNLDMQQFLAVGPVAEHLRMSIAQVTALYRKAEDLAK